MLDRFELKKGLNVPMAGAPEAVIDVGPTLSRVGVLGRDYVGMKPSIAVSEGETVRRGQTLFVDKKTEGVHHVSPVHGRVVSVLRGEKRSFIGIELEVVGDEAQSVQIPSSLNADRGAWIDCLLKSGAWVGLRSRPFGKIADPRVQPKAIFVNAMDTNPLAGDPAMVIAQAKESFADGLQVVAQLVDGTVYVCRGTDQHDIPGEGIEGVRVAEFAGPHPAGLVGTHMHFLSPVNEARCNWYLGYQDVIAIGRLAKTGRYDAQRVVALGGGLVSKPRMVRTILGASLTQLLQGQTSGEGRVISGSPLCGQVFSGAQSYLGRYHQQVCVLPEGNRRELLGWQMPGFDKFSVTRAFASAWAKTPKFNFTTSTGGSERAMVPIGTYERVVPLDLLPTLLLRSLITRDIERSAELGCLELEEEDLALCTFVCPGKYEYGEILRSNLQMIEKEG
jgi:Na+-transporting NADH:ubiquinone oxidoreductase subunit A